MLHFFNEQSILEIFGVSHSFQNHGNYCNQPHLVSDYWVGHCIVNESTRLEEMEEEKKTIDITLNLHQKSSQIPDGLTNRSKHRCTIEVIHRTLPQRYMSRLGFNGFNGHFTFCSLSLLPIYFKSSIMHINVCGSVGHKILLCLYY